MIVLGWDMTAAAADSRANGPARGVMRSPCLTIQRFTAIRRYITRTGIRYGSACADHDVVICAHIGTGTKAPHASPRDPHRRVDHDHADIDR